MSRRRTVERIALFLIATTVPSLALAQAPSKVLPTPQAPSKTLPSSSRVIRSFEAMGLKKVVLRAGFASSAEVKTVPGGRAIIVSGIPEGGALGYHPSDPNWRETPASQWGLDFKARPFGTTLIVATENEMIYIHHHYNFANLTITVPEGVEVVKENLVLEGKGKGPADLSPLSRP